MTNAVPNVPWYPAELASKLHLSHVAELAAAAGDLILLVRLNEFSRELQAGLELQPTRSSNGGGPITLPPIARVEEATSVGQGESTLTQRSALPAERRFPSELLSAPCFLLSVRDCAARAGRRRLTIGRAFDNDIVLRHASVSRRHAHLDVGKELVISDAGSVNHTWVSGAWTETGVTLHDLDMIKLGAVQMLLCRPSSLWAAVRTSKPGP